MYGGEGHEYKKYREYYIRTAENAARRIETGRKDQKCTTAAAAKKGKVA